MGEARGALLLRDLERAAYLAAAPVLARMPAVIGYRVACWRGDWACQLQAGKRAELERNLRQVLGNEVSPAVVHQVMREWFRLASCEAVDVRRLRHGAGPLRRLVEVRGRGHLEAALAAGKGAILCSAHFGSYLSAFSVLHASGFPVTTIGRWWYNYDPGISSAERRVWDLHLKPVRRHQQRPNIEPWPGRLEVAAMAAEALRANEVVTVCIDAPPLNSDQERAIEVPFLGLRARLLPGAVVLAQLTGAPLLTCFMHRAVDYRHQVLEISPPMPVIGETVATFERFAAEVSAAIQRNPAHWYFWASAADLADLGLTSRLPGCADTAAGRGWLDGIL